MPGIGGMGNNVGQYGHGNVASSSLQNSFAGLSVAAAPASLAGHRRASRLGNHLLTEDRPRNFARGSRRGRHHRRQHSNQGSRVSNGKVHKDANKSHYLGPNRPVPHNSSGVSAASQQASDMATQGRALSTGAVPQSGSHYNTFGANIPEFLPQRGPNMAAEGPAVPTIPVRQYENRFSAQNASNVAAQNRILPLVQISQSGFPYNLAAASRNVAAQQNSHSTMHALPAIQEVQPRFSFNPSVGTWNVSSAQHIAGQGPGIYATSLPDPSYYGPYIHMSAFQKDLIMAANGIKLPATYIPDPGYYHGPLHSLVKPVVQAIINAAESSQHPDYPFFRPRSNLAQVTMLTPYGLPPQCYIPGTSQMDIHIAECNRHMELMKEVLAVPGKPEHNEEPMRWYRIIGEPRLRRVQPVWHPNVIDLYGRESQYEQLLVRDVNHRNNNEKGVGRKNAPGNRQTQAAASMRVDPLAQKAIQQETNIGIGQSTQKTTAKAHARQESEETSVFFRDHRTPISSHTKLQYLGYRMRVKRQEEPSPEISPTPPSRGRSAQASAAKKSLNLSRSASATYEQKRAFSTTVTPLDSKKRYSGTNEEEGETSASKTPLLDFDSRYTAKHGEGEDVDFALRDLGPPRFGGKTFNEKIGFTPSPEKNLGSEAPFGYPMNVLRRHRD